MGKTYDKFLRSGVDLGPLGCSKGGELYFCTPKGASLIGSAGVDGVHYCFVRGFGETVFAVSPMNQAEHRVHPIARDFDDLQALLLACGSMDALEQAWLWDKAAFEGYLRDNPPSEAQQAVLESMGRKHRPMAQPYEYLTALREGFDYGRLKFEEDLLEPPAREQPDWAVYFDGGFWEEGAGKPGAAIPLDVTFDWAGHRWQAPAAYACAAGLVLDLCMELAPEEEPELHFDPVATVNGQALRSSHGGGTVYRPGDQDDPEPGWTAAHYGLDRDKGWLLWRAAFPWAAKREPVIRQLALTLVQQPVGQPGPVFPASKAGDRIEFICPAEGSAHTLTVEEYLRQETEFSGAPAGFEFPTHHHTMAYRVEPPLAPGMLTVRDTHPGDRPRTVSLPGQPESRSVALVLGRVTPEEAKEGLQAVCSSLRFAPVETVTWQLWFYWKQVADGTFILK